MGPIFCSDTTFCSGFFFFLSLTFTICLILFLGVIYMFDVIFH